MPVSLPEVVLEGVYAAPDHQERIVREIVNGKVVYEAREESSAQAWSPGHALEDSPSIESFAAACLRLISKPERYSRHDAV